MVELHATSKSYQAGKHILKKGGLVSSAVIITSGIVKVFRVDENDNSHFLYFLTEGELCVLSTLCCMRIRQADMRAVAFTDCEVMYIPSPNPENWMQQYPEWSLYVMQSFNRRMSELLDTFDSVVFSHLDERLVFYLRLHYKVTGEMLSLSHQQIADEVNSSREVISRLLKKLEDAGYVQVNRLYVKILPAINSSILGV
jgi:CRP/FNR family transcriptional regulator